MKMRKCKSCNIYTFKELCPSCKSPTGQPHPPRFSPQDPYGKYRRRMKAEAGVYQ
ncbi:MAG: RNA-protein complex protein Nop10 [Candidatus Hadarchaeales archaeon]